MNIFGYILCELRNVLVYTVAFRLLQAKMTVKFKTTDPLGLPLPPLFLFLETQTPFDRYFRTWSATLTISSGLRLIHSERSTCYLTLTWLCFHLRLHGNVQKRLHFLPVDVRSRSALFAIASDLSGTFLHSFFY